MKLRVRRSHVIKSMQRESEGIESDRPLEKIAIVLVMQNPYDSGRYVSDLGDLTNASIEIGRQMAKLAAENCDAKSVESYGKGGIAGLGGAQEHVNAMLTTVFADPFREAIGGGKAWISSVTKVGAPGTLIDVPLNHKNDVYVRSHYDAMSLSLPDTPMPDEIALIFCMANRGRLNARVGGLTHEEVMART